VTTTRKPHKPRPVFVGMPPTDRVLEVDPFGRIRCGGRCRDDYDRIVIAHEGGRVVKLQAAAMRSFQAAEDAVGEPILLTGIGWRSCRLQRELWEGDPARFADPDKTAHTRGLAIDVHTGQGAKRLEAIRRALLWRGWHQARPTDEPWHYSFGIQV